MGGEKLAPTQAENRARNTIEAPRKSEKDAMRALASVDGANGFSSRAEFCDCLSDVVAAFPRLPGLTTKSNRYVWDHLYSACDPCTSEWYLNNERIRRRIRCDMGEFMAFGATGSDAVNRELKGWFDRIMQLHAPMLRLKLRIFQVSKLMAFCSARYNETTVQERQPVVLRRQLNDWEICDNWSDWRSEQDPCEIPGKNAQMQTRDAHASRLAGWKRANDVTKTQRTKRKRGRRFVKISARYRQMSDCPRALKPRRPMRRDRFELDAFCVFPEIRTMRDSRFYL